MSKGEIDIIMGVLIITVWLPFCTWVIIRSVKSTKRTWKQIGVLREELKGLKSRNP